MSDPAFFTKMAELLKVDEVRQLGTLGNSLRFTLRIGAFATMVDVSLAASLQGRVGETNAITRALFNAAVALKDQVERERRRQAVDDMMGRSPEAENEVSFLSLQADPSVTLEDAEPATTADRFSAIMEEMEMFK